MGLIELRRIEASRKVAATLAKTPNVSILNVDAGLPGQIFYNIKPIIWKSNPQTLVSEQHRNWCRFKIFCTL
ncbi:Prohibitin-3, mitochondrial [Quillaja saponaria]|uniref:Prohibitin-3, mitochondrial n=1 Tax=Quillaja saponaria TaxID=32244 RepID=A0AAD7PX54_QUISA|nr:Prohibitin-3, mitochondrial [Quillaja saponaria]